MKKGIDLGIFVSWIVTALAMPVAIWMVFLYAEEEAVMGAPQRIFYFHVPIAIVTFLAVYVLLAGAVGYLWTRKPGWDHLSRAATEIGLLFCTLVLVTGPIWAKPAWGVWWTWEPKLTTTLVLWVLLAAALMVRNYAEDSELGARLAAIVGIVAALDVPIIHRAAVWWGGHHPVLFDEGQKSPLAPKMGQTFLFCMLLFLVLFGLLLMLRYRAAQVELRSETLAQQLADGEMP
ncbi:MAG: cytochrome c biogenesis protein CcsA [bacterium]|nr:cytochrome c biogenesis protein CcsA [bacterium]